MLNTRIKLIFGCLLIFGLFLRFTGFTSADLFAERNVKNNRFSVATLAFDELNTANNFAITRLFDVTGIVPGGFAVNSVRIKKTGQLNFKYFLKTEIISEDKLLCQGLNLQLMQSGSFKTQASLADFNYQSTISTEVPEDWIFFLSLNRNDLDLRYQNCQFNLIFTTQNQIGPKKGIYAERTLLNDVTSGNWD